MIRVLAYVRRHHLGLLALLVMLGGTAYAANQVSGKDIKNKSITAKDVKPNALSSKQVTDSGLGGGDVADGSVGAADMADGSVGSPDVADGSLRAADVVDDSITGADIDESDLSISRIVARLRDPEDHPVSRTSVAPAAVGQTASWTQRADEYDTFAGQVTVSFPAGCKGTDRGVSVRFLRPGGQAGPPARGVAANAQANSFQSGDVTVVAPIVRTTYVPALSEDDPGRFEPGSDVTRSLSVVASGYCGSNSTADPVITDMKLDVLAFR